MDFEALSAKDENVPVESLQIRRAVKGLEGATARRVGMHIWLEAQRGHAQAQELPGEIWSSSRFLVGALVMAMMFLGGVGVMTGMLDRERMAFPIPMVLGVAVGLQLLVLLIGFLGWLFRGRFSKGLGLVSSVLGWLLGKIGGGRKMDWWRRLRLEGGRGWEALGWNLLRLTQSGAIMFSVGLMTGLLGCIWFIEVGFFWESTTPEWMAQKIYEVCSILGAPWSWAFPLWVPSREVVEGSRLPLVDGLNYEARWYPFLFCAIAFWGLMPRFILWVFAVFKERKALGSLDFQTKRHRALWRDLMGTRRTDTSEAPLDGVLVLDVGGTGLKQEDLRGFMLRTLRVNPGEWYEVGVWDEKGEASAAESIRNAPAGVLLLAEGWALSPPRMRALQAQIRSLSGPETAIYFLVTNVGADGGPAPVMAEEKEIWRDMVDGLADAAAEIFFYEKEEGK